MEGHPEGFGLLNCESGFSRGECNTRTPTYTLVRILTKREPIFGNIRCTLAWLIVYTPDALQEATQGQPIDWLVKYITRDLPYA